MERSQWPLVKGKDADYNEMMILLLHLPENWTYKYLVHHRWCRYCWPPTWLLPTSKVCPFSSRPTSMFRINRSFVLVSKQPPSRCILSQLESAMNCLSEDSSNKKNITIFSLLPSARNENEMEVDLSAEDAQTVVLFNICVLSELGLAKSNLIAVRC